MMTPEQRAAQAVDDLAKYFGNYCEETVEYAESVISGQIRAAIAEAAPQWIPVGERLPDDDEGEVLITFNQNWPGGESGGVTSACYYYADRWGDEDGRVADQITVTHWMPLPAKVGKR